FAALARPLLLDLTHDDGRIVELHQIARRSDGLNLECCEHRQDEMCDHPGTHVSLPCTPAHSVSSAITDEMFAEESCHARVEVLVKGCSIEVPWIVGADARDGGRELRRAGCQERKVAGWHDVNIRLARKAICNASIVGTVTDPWSSTLGAPELEGNFDRGQIISRKGRTRWIDNNRGLDTCIMWRVGHSLPVMKLRTRSGLLLTSLRDLPEIRRDPDQHQARITSFGETEQTDSGGIDDRFVFP